VVVVVVVVVEVVVVVVRYQKWSYCQMGRVVVMSLVVTMWRFSLPFFVLLMLLLRVHQQLLIMRLQPLQPAHTMFCMRTHARGARVQPLLLRQQPLAPPPPAVWPMKLGQGAAAIPTCTTCNGCARARACVATRTPPRAASYYIV